MIKRNALIHHGLLSQTLLRDLREFTKRTSLDANRNKSSFVGERKVSKRTNLSIVAVCCFLGQLKNVLYKVHILNSVLNIEIIL